MYINESKTKYMEWTDKEFKPGQQWTVTVGDDRTYRFEEVKSFEYLGATFS